MNTDVNLVTGDSTEFHWGTGTFASRGAVVAANAINASAILVKDKVLKLVNEIADDVTESKLFEAIDHGSDTGGANKRFWTLDPIDGTKGFLRKDQYAIALALIENGEIVVGILGCIGLEIAPIPR